MKKFSEKDRLAYFADRIAGKLNIVAWQKIDPSYQITITTIDEKGELFKQCMQDNSNPVYESITQWKRRQNDTR